MNENKRALYLILFIVAIGAILIQTKKTGLSSDITSDEIMGHIRYLSHESRGGRFPGTRGSKDVIAYMVKHLKSYGIEPGANHSYVQPFDITSGIKLGDGNYALVNGDSLFTGEDYIPLWFSSNGTTEGSIVFAGYGFDINEEELTNRIGNKMIRPTTVPQSMEELKIEQAIAREALRLSFIQHKSFAVNLKGVQKERTISDAFEQSDSGLSLVDMMELDLLVGSGGVLSHAPRREQSARMLIDSFLPEGITQLAVDSIFMMPQLGVLANIDERDLAKSARKAALEVFNKDCLIRLGTCISPVGKANPGDEILTATLVMPDQSEKQVILRQGELLSIPAEYEPIDAKLTPAKGMDVGAGKNEEINTTLYGGVVGLVFDGRGRPFHLPTDNDKRIESLNIWSNAMNEYPVGEDK